MRFTIFKALYFLSLSIFSGNIVAETYTLAVQPVLPAKQIEKNYKPLTDYLSEKTGHTFVIQSYRNFLTYWIKMKKKKGNDMDFILDAAHFTDFRVQRKDYKVLVKMLDTVSFTVVTNEDNFVFEMEELIAKKIATMPSPGLSAVRLNEMFPNPMRIPLYIQANDSVDAVNKVLDGTVAAAIIPSPLVGNYDALYSVISTEPVPHMALSAAPTVPDKVIQKVKIALLQATETPDGQKMLGDLKIAGFENANAEIYAGYANLLDGVFGY